MSGTADILTVQNPRSGEQLSTWSIAGTEQVRDTVEAARQAAQAWWELGFRERRRRLSAWRAQMAQNLDELAELVHHETGKPRTDAQLEIVVALGHMAWSGANARRVLRPRRVSSGLLALNHSATMWYEPMGVVGVIGPWNYPVLTPIGSIAYALAAGNAVVYKPSEFTPGVGEWMRQAWERANPDFVELFQVVIGAGETGAALCSSGIDLLGFTGSTRTGRIVMRTCADALVPVILECGGKDAMLVDADADLAGAADTAVWAGLSNAGQTCLGVERIYVVESVYARFLAEVTQRVDRLVTGAEAEAEAGSGSGLVDAAYGPMTTPTQSAVVRAHIEAGQADGGVLHRGGVEPGPWLKPTILTQVPATSRALQEETFGPVLVINSVPTLQDAVREANSSGFGLGSAVYTKKKRVGMTVARQLRTGMVSINGVLAFASVGALPLGGVGESGFGRVHGADGLRAFSRPKSVTRQRFPLPIQLTSFDRPGSAVRWIARILGWWHSRA